MFPGWRIFLKMWVSALHCHLFSNLSGRRQRRRSNTYSEHSKSSLWVFCTAKVPERQKPLAKTCKLHMYHQQNFILYHIQGLNFADWGHSVINMLISLLTIYKAVSPHLFAWDFPQKWWMLHKKCEKRGCSCLLRRPSTPPHLCYLSWKQKDHNPFIICTYRHGNLHK